MSVTKSAINPQRFLRFELKVRIQSDFFVMCHKFYTKIIKTSCRRGCKKYRNRQAKCIALKKDGLKFRNIALYKNDYKHLFKDGIPKGLKQVV